MDKKRFYSILYLVCLVLLINSLPFSLIIESKLVLFIINIIIKVISIIYILYYIKKEELNNIKKEKLAKDSIKLLPLLLLCGSNFVVVFIQSASIKTDIDIFSIITGLIVSVGVGIIEELLFRGQVLEELLKHKNKFIALIYSSIIFGMVHLLNITLSNIPTVVAQCAYTAFLGLVLGFIYISTKNIYLPIIFHILFNFLNDILVIELFDLKWDLTFFLVNILIGLILSAYIYFAYIFKKKEGIKHASEHMDN